MSRRRLTRAVGDYVRGFQSEDGANYRTETQELGPAIARARAIAHAQEHAGTGKYDRRYIGSVPMTMIVDWLNKRGYTMDQWARNEGGSPCPVGSDPVEHCKRDGGIKSQFLRYFLTREHSKLHTQHTTTRTSAGIIVPTYTGGKRENTGRTEVSDTKLAQ